MPGWLDLVWGTVVVGLVWWINHRRDIEITSLHDRVEDLEMARPVKIEDPPARLRGLRQDR